VPRPHTAHARWGRVGRVQGEADRARQAACCPCRARTRPGHQRASTRQTRLDGTLEVMLPAGLPITRPSPSSSPAQSTSPWSQDVHGSDTAQLPHAQSRQPDDGDDPLPAGGDRRDTATMPGRVRELGVSIAGGFAAVAPVHRARTTAAEADPPPENSDEPMSIRQFAARVGHGDGDLARQHAVRRLPAHGTTTSRRHFGMVADELQPPPTLAISRQTARRLQRPDRQLIRCCAAELRVRTACRHVGRARRAMASTGVGGGRSADGLRKPQCRSPLSVDAAHAHCLNERAVRADTDSDHTAVRALESR